MGWFDVPHTGYGTYFNPEMVFTVCNNPQLGLLKEKCKELEINYERWFVGRDVDVHEALNSGVIVYFPQYNCIRNADHFDGPRLVTFPDFCRGLRKHPKHLGSFFIKTPGVGHRLTIITWFKTRGYNIHPTIPIFDFETAVLINEPMKTLVTHRPERADENEKEGYPVMTYEDFKIYMQ